MTITIAQRLRPYSHAPGVWCVLPGSFFCLQLFPCLIRLYDNTQSEPLLRTEIELGLQGPVNNFTVQCDLEKGCISVEGCAVNGFYRLKLWASETGLDVHMQVIKAPVEGLMLTPGKFIQPGESYCLLQNESPFRPYQVQNIERLSLGNHKAQDWDLVQRRLDLIEILPTWHRLGQLVPAGTNNSSLKGTATLLKSCQRTIESGKPETITPAFLNLFRAGFKGILTPRLKDEDFLGVIPSFDLITDLSPFILLTQGYHLIRSLFVQERAEGLFLLPDLPPEFHAGRLVNVVFKGGSLDIEWSKKTMRRLIIKSTTAQTLPLYFKKVNQFRLRVGSNETKNVTFSSQATIVFEKNCYYVFDNFR